jgi:hypothetical protein
VELLAEHGADLQATDAYGRTALDIARGAGIQGVRPDGDGFPETAARLESLMAGQGLPTPAP